MAHLVRVKVVFSNDPLELLRKQLQGMRQVNDAFKQITIKYSLLMALVANFAINHVCHD